MSEHIGFHKLERKVYRFYLEKGYKPEEARDIARRTAAKVFWQKYGKEEGIEIIKRAKRS